MIKSGYVFLFVVTVVISVHGRTWSDYKGKTVEAEFVSSKYGMVTLRTGEGKTMKISLAKLSKEDQAFVKKNSKKKPAAKSSLSFSSSSSTAVEPVAGDPEVVKLMVPGKVFKRVAKGDTGISYHVYTPTGFDPENPPPLIISFSPGGNGLQMVNSMKSSAEKAGWLLIGCNQLKNNMKEESVVIRKMEDELINDIFARIPNDPRRIYLAGFSGGAARSYGISARREERITGIIAYGGWLGGDKFFDKPYCKYMAIAMVNGDGDKAANSWTSKDENALNRRSCNVEEFSFEGGHAIAPANVIDDVITWLNKDWDKSGAKRTKWR